MTCDFLQNFAEAKEYGDEMLAAFLLDSDLLVYKMNAEQRSECIFGALQCGYEVAQNLLSTYGGQVPFVMAEKMELKVMEADLPPDRAVISSFDPSVGTIALNSAIFDMIDVVMEKYGLGELFGRFTPRDVAVCHELFHYVESLDETLFTMRYKITLWRLGSFAYHSTIQGVSEIGAMACAKSLCRLAVNPVLLDVLALEGMNPQRVQSWFGKLKQGSL